MLIRELTAYDPYNRPTLEDVLRSRFSNLFSDRLSRHKLEVSIKCLDFKNYASSINIDNNGQFNLSGSKYKKKSKS